MNTTARTSLWSTLTLLATSASLVATDVSGLITNQTWTTSGSPFRAVGDLQVASLTIKPGVEVTFAGNYVFAVTGTLQAAGTAAAPIVFATTNGGWQGLWFNAAQPGCVLAHCTIANALNSGIRIHSSAPALSQCIISNNSAPCSGGGIWSDAPLALSQCVVVSNSVHCVTGSGAGLYSTAPLALSRCAIVGNSIVAVGGNSPGASCQGAGLYAAAPVTLFDCLVSGNTTAAVASNWAAFSQGAGLWCGADALLQYCNISFNAGSVYGANSTPQSWGGGIYCTGQLTVQSCIISSNSTSTVCNPGPSPAYAYGGGVFALALLANNTIFHHNATYAQGAGPAPNNQGQSEGGGICLSSTSQVVNCTIAYSAATASGSPPVSRGGGCYSGAPSNSVQFLNSIFWGNAPDQIYGPVTASFCDVQGGQAGTGNISGNPNFLSAADLIILPGSPCIDAGSTNAAYHDCFFPPSLGSAVNDMGAHGGPGAGARLTIQAQPQIAVLFLGGVPGYAYVVQGSTNLHDWQTLQSVPIAHVGDAACFLESSTNTLPRRFYKLNLAP